MAELTIPALLEIRETNAGLGHVLKCRVREQDHVIFLDPETMANYERLLREVALLYGGEARNLSDAADREKLARTGHFRCEDCGEVSATKQPEDEYDIEVTVTGVKQMSSWVVLEQLLAEMLADEEAVLRFITAIDKNSDYRRAGRYKMHVQLHDGKKLNVLVDVQESPVEWD